MRAGLARRPLAWCLAVMVMMAGSMAVSGTPPPADDSSTVYVTARYAGGEVETFSKEVEAVDLILDSTGQIYAAHLILSAAKDRDSHRWLFVRNLASLTYRYGSVGAKGKVRLKRLAEIKGDPAPTPAPEGTVISIDPRDYR